MIKKSDDKIREDDSSGEQSGSEDTRMLPNHKNSLAHLLKNVLAGKSGAKEKLYAFFMANRFNLNLIKPTINKLLEMQKENVYAREFNSLVDYKADFNLKHLFTLAETKAAKANEAKAEAINKEPKPIFNPSPLRTRLTPNKSDLDEL